MKRTTMTAVAAGLAITSIAAAQPTDTTINVIPIRDVPNIELIRPSPKVPLQVLEHDTQPVIEVVFVLDTTGSMGGLIEGAKQKIWSIANMMSTGNPAPKIRIGLVGYRDRSDAYITTAVPMADDLDLVYAKLTEFQAAGGGDGPESVNQALAEAVNDTQWSDGDSVLRIVYLVGDAPPHMDYQDDIKYPQTCEAAARKGIIINTIQCGMMSETAPVWKEIAKSAEGEYFAIEQSGGVVAVTTPYDEELAQLGVDLRATNLYYGDREMNMRQQAREELATRNDKAIADRPAAAAERAAYLASGAGGASLGAEQELLRDISEGTVKLVDVKDDELPDVMQSMNESEREAYVKDQLHRREQIALRINDLNAKRTEFMKNELVKNGPVSSFDTSVLEAMRKQAVRAGIEYREETPSPSEKELEKDNGDK